MELCVELQDKRYMRQSLKLITSLSNFNGLRQITRSSQTLERIRRLVEGSFRKVSPFLASQILHRIVSKTNGHRFASKWEGTLALQTSVSDRSAMLLRPIFSQSSALVGQPKKTCKRSSVALEQRCRIHSPGYAWQIN